jgi:hypothetical protein
VAAITTAVITNAVGADIAADIATAQADLNIITGASGVKLLTATQASIDAIEIDTGTTLDNHLTDIKGTAFVKDTHSLIDIEAYVDILDDATSGNAKIATDAAAIYSDTTIIASDVVQVYSDTTTIASDMVIALSDIALTASPPQLLQSTTITNLVTQTSFDLSAGSADDDAYNGAIVVVTDAVTATQKAVGSVSDYTGSTKTITLTADPAVFTMADGDSIDVVANVSTAPTAVQNRQEMDSNSTQLAAIASDLVLVYSDTTVIASDVVIVVSDTTAIHSDTTVIASDVVVVVSDTTAIHSDTTLVTAGVDVTSISGSSTAADNLEASALAIVSTTVNDPSATTTAFIITSSEATDDHFNGRIIVFTSGALLGQATDITDYAGTTRTVTVTALTQPPADGVAFVIV